MAGPLSTELADVTKWFPQEKTGIEPGHTARIRGTLVTLPPSQTWRPMSSSLLYFLMLGVTGSGERMLPPRGRGSGLTEHPGATPAGVAANRIMTVVSTILSQLIMGGGPMPLLEIKDGSYVSIRWLKCNKVLYTKVRL